MRNKTTIHREARAILVELASTYPVLADLPLRVSGRMTRAAGKAVWKRGTPFEIVLSLPFFADEQNVLREVVTHEAAHIVAGINAGHGPQWKMVHRAMGGNAQRCHTMTLANGYKSRRRALRITVTCPKCGHAMQLGPTQAKKLARGASYSHSRCPQM